jgi:ADP-dependent NAD(P)H-hydrate dehydratase / NAD(P)H-hydrate epimerase
MKLVTAAQMRELDRLAIHERGIPGGELMESAGLAVAEAAVNFVAQIPDHPIVVVCGKGNNGGDGFVAARLLAVWGFPVQVVLAAKGEEVTGDARHNLLRLTEVSLEVVEVTDAAAVRPLLQPAPLIIDALLGTGLTGEVRGLAAGLIQAMNDSGRPVLAVDLPSGLHADTGAVLGVAVQATVTVTMGLPKLGLHLYPGVDLAGRVIVADIGFPADLVAASPCAAELTEAEWVRSVLPRRVRSAHKGTFGRVLIVAGSVGMTGAATLAAQAALRMGSGLVYVACPESLNDVLEVKLTEAITLPQPETVARTLHPRALDGLLSLAAEVDVLAIGPGISRHPETAGLIRDLVARVPTPFVLDADGLNAVAGEGSVLAGEHAPAVLTPHPGEMGRLLGMGSEEVQAQRLEAAQRAAKMYHSVVVLKGASSLVVELGRQAMVNPTGNPGLATAGAGDVLTGVIASLIGQGLSPFAAAAAGAYVHGLAGDVAAQSMGEASLLAGDVVDALPAAIRRVAAAPEGGELYP